MYVHDIKIESKSTCTYLCNKSLHVLFKKQAIIFSIIYVHDQGCPKVRVHMFINMIY